MSPRKSQRNLTPLFFALGAVALSSCNREEPINYPSGAWWHDVKQLNDGRYAVAQILIADNAGAQEQEIHWPSWVPLPNRSRDEALRIAKETLAMVRAHPDRFSALAKERSDDPMSAPLGGMLGIVNPAALPNEACNALLSIHDNEISHLVESPLGFHLIERLPLPADAGAKISASEIVVTYAGTDYQHRLGRTITRSRDEALALAKRLSIQAKAQPDSFPSLVREFSDAPDAALDGDLGAWTTLDQNPPPALTYALSALKVGEVSPPVETRWGFHILRRSDRTQRDTFAASEIFVTFEEAPLHGILDSKIWPSRAAAEQLMTSLIGELKTAPEKFDQLALAHCRSAMCLDHGHLAPWTEARSEPEFDIVLRGLKIGEIAPKAIETSFGFHLLRRDAPAAYAAPAAPTAEDWIRKAQLSKDPARTGEFVAERLELFKEDALVELELEGAEAAAFAKLLDRFVAGVRTGGPQALGALNEENKNGVRKLLGAARAARYLTYRDAWWQKMRFSSGLDPRALPANGEAAAKLLKELQAKETAELPLVGQEAASYAEIFTTLSATLAAAPLAQRQAALLDARAEVKSLLGKERFKTYNEIQQRWLTQRSTPTPR